MWEKKVSCEPILMPIEWRQSKTIVNSLNRDSEENINSASTTLGENSSEDSGYLTVTRNTSKADDFVKGDTHSQNSPDATFASTISSTSLVTCDESGQHYTGHQQNIRPTTYRQRSKKFMRRAQGKWTRFVKNMSHDHMTAASRLEPGHRMHKMPRSTSVIHIISNEQFDGMNFKANLPGHLENDSSNSISPLSKSSDDKSCLNNGSSIPDTEFEGTHSDRYDNLSSASLKRSTSRSSLASTFGVMKEKLVSSLPAELAKKPEETKLRVAVFVLFSLCFSLVLASHVLYNQHIGEIRLFPNVRLEEEQRRMIMYDKNDNFVLSAELGIDIPRNLDPYNCLPNQLSQTDPSDTKCLEWKDHARLKIQRIKVRDLTCHRISWLALSEDTMPFDCWPVGEGAGHWYGGGESLTSQWPLDNGHIVMSPFVTGDEDQTEWGNVIKKYFINSRGLSIDIADETPLSLSLNDDVHKGLCLKAHFDEFPYYYHRYGLPQLNYTVCTDGDLVELYDGQLAKSFWDGHKDSDLQELTKLLKLPLWQVPEMENGGTYSMEHISNYLTAILGRKDSGTGTNADRGYLLLDYHWQNHMGDIELAQNLRGIEKLVSDAGLTLVLTLNPFVSTDSKNFLEGISQGIYVMERKLNNTRNIPALTWFKDVPAAALLDVTNNETVAWFKQRLTHLHKQLRTAVFFLDSGNTFHTPHYFQFKENLYNPDLYKEHFIRTCMQVVKVIGVSGASSKRPKAPAFVHLTTLNSTWASLRTIIPNVLNLGVIGYPFISPGPVGGTVRHLRHAHVDLDAAAADNATTQTTTVRSPLSAGSPDRELFIRWWQLATFLPQLHFTTPPTAYNNKYIAPIAGKLKHLKENVVNKHLIYFGREAMEMSKPVIRPLWMLNPNDSVSQRIDDQFLIGDTILVAPILDAGARKRDVYLPMSSTGVGVWKSGTDGTFYKGGQWLNQTVVELDTILYFERQSDFARPGQ